MVKGILLRHTYWQTGTYGKLSVAGLELCTAECPWLNNKKFVSCLPEGLYTVELWNSPSKGKCYIITGRGVVKENDSTNKRFSCLVHKANWPDELRGCVAPGLKFMPINSGGRLWPKHIGVTDSGKAMNKMFEVLPNSWELEIKSIKADFVEPHD